jgi:outer membrane receptor for ferrienterochelin and colicin
VATPFNKFDVLHDKGSVFVFSGEVTYAASEKLNVNFGAKYNAYSLDSLKAPYHKPISEIKLGVSFLITEKIRIWSDIYYYGKRTAIDLSVLPNTQIDLDGFVDLNLGVDYKLTKELSAFLSLTNLLNNQYQRYYHYPVNGIQVMGGIMYKF